MALVRQNLGNIMLSDDGGNLFARSIMTTDTHPKEVAVSTQIDGREIVIGGCAKGSGMIHPNMATMLSFVTTDAAVEPSFLQQSLKNAADTSFNMIDIDGDQSTNDTLVVLANGRAGGDEIYGGTPAGENFQEALIYVCVELAKEMARDGEGATHLVEVTVEGARTLHEARLAARKIVSSLLVKAMIYGRDPNWGRVMMALGNSGIDFEETDVDIFVNEIHIVHEGMSIAYLKDAVVSSMSEGRGENKGPRRVGRGHCVGLGLRSHGRIRNRELSLQHVVVNAFERLGTRNVSSELPKRFDEARRSIETAPKAAYEQAEAKQ